VLFSVAWTDVSDSPMRQGGAGEAPGSSGQDAVGATAFRLEATTVACSAPLREELLDAADALLARASAEAVSGALSESPLKGEAWERSAALAGRPAAVVALPLYEGDRLAGCLCHLREAPPGTMATPASPAILPALQTASLLERLAEARSETERIRSRFRKVAAFMELLASSEGGIDFSECSRRLANHLSEILGCDLVALSVRGRFGHRLAAVSGESGPAEGHSSGRRALLAHLSETAHRGEAILSRRASETGGTSEAAAAATLREHFDPALSLCLPLKDAEGNVRGAWLFLWNREPADFEERRSLIGAAAPEVAPLLSLLHRAKPGSFAGALLRYWRRGTQSKRRFLSALALAALAAAALPLPYPVKATCEMQPVLRRVVAAPFDGILQGVSARAGEVVEEGQLLARLDGRELRSQLAEAIARRERALKESDAALAEGLVAESRIAALEAEGLAHQIDLLDYRLRHLEVRSPIAGLVLQGDLERSEGAPLRVGDPLFEVGPLERLLAEVAVPAKDISLIRPGAKVTLKLESHLHGTVEAEIQQIAPKSTWLDDRNVFLCEAEIENPEGVLRAGLKGKAKVAGPRRPLLWIWGRDAWLALRYHLW